MKIPFKKKKQTPAVQRHDEESMFILMAAFREVMRKHLKDLLPPGSALDLPGVLLGATEFGQAYRIGVCAETQAALVLVQGKQGTPAPITSGDAQTILDLLGDTAQVHLYAARCNDADSLPEPIVLHPLPIDPFKLIPDLYRKARASRALLAALQLLGKKEP